MTHELEQHLIDMGILPATTLEALEDNTATLSDRDLHFAKDYFNDPRDENGEVDF